MKIKGWSFKRENPFFVYFKKHYCPYCGNRLERQKVSEVINNDSKEAKKYDFEVADIIHTGLCCPSSAAPLSDLPIIQNSVKDPLFSLNENGGLWQTEHPQAPIAC